MRSSLRKAIVPWRAPHRLDERRQRHSCMGLFVAGRSAFWGREWFAEALREVAECSYRRWRQSYPSGHSFRS